MLFYGVPQTAEIYEEAPNQANSGKSDLSSARLCTLLVTEDEHKIFDVGVG